jgi:hypothetical protein
MYAMHNPRKKKDSSSLKCLHFNSLFSPNTASVTSTVNEKRANPAANVPPSSTTERRDPPSSQQILRNPLCSQSNRQDPSNKSPWSFPLSFQYYNPSRRLDHALHGRQRRVFLQPFAGAGVGGAKGELDSLVGDSR